MVYIAVSEYGQSLWACQGIVNGELCKNTLHSGVQGGPAFRGAVQEPLAFRNDSKKMNLRRMDGKDQSL